MHTASIYCVRNETQIKLWPLVFLSSSFFLPLTEFVRESCSHLQLSSFFRLKITQTCKYAFPFLQFSAECLCFRSRGITPPGWRWEEIRVVHACTVSSECVFALCVHGRASEVWTEMPVKSGQTANQRCHWEGLCCRGILQADIKKLFTTSSTTTATITIIIITRNKCK